MDKIDVFDVQIPDGRQISCISYNKVTYFDLDDICKLCLTHMTYMMWLTSNERMPILQHVSWI